MSGLVALRSKPVDIVGIVYDGTNIYEIRALMLGRKAFGSAPCIRKHPHGAHPVVYLDPAVDAEVWHEPSKSWAPVAPGYWIVRGTENEFYAIPPDVLATKYDVTGYA